MDTTRLITKTNYSYNSKQTFYLSTEFHLLGRIYILLKITIDFILKLCQQNQQNFSIDFQININIKCVGIQHKVKVGMCVQ